MTVFKTVFKDIAMITEIELNTQIFRRCTFLIIFLSDRSASFLMKSGGADFLRAAALLFSSEQVSLKMNVLACGWAIQCKVFVDSSFPSATLDVYHNFQIIACV